VCVIAVAMAMRLTDFGPCDILSMTVCFLLETYPPFLKGNLLIIFRSDVSKFFYVLILFDLYIIQGDCGGRERSSHRRDKTCIQNFYRKI
jgi:hypothetical protein